jgi:hypothetical protein
MIVEEVKRCNRKLMGAMEDTCWHDKSMVAMEVEATILTNFLKILPLECQQGLSKFLLCDTVFDSRWTILNLELKLSKQPI